MVKKNNSNQIWDTHKCQYKCKNPRKSICKKGYAWKVAKCSFENSKYLGSIFEGLEIICDDIKKTTKGNQTKTTPEKGTPRKFNENNVVWKMKKFLYFTCFYINYLNIYNMF